MKRTIGLGLAAVMLVALAGWAAADDDEWRGRGRGHGPGYGMGHGYGYHMDDDWGRGMGRGPGAAVWANLTGEKREALQSLHNEHMQAVLPLRGELQARMITLHEAMSAYPVDEQAVREARQAVDASRDALFAARLSFHKQAQEVLGEEAWKALPFGKGPGPMGPRFDDDDRGSGRGPRR